MSRSAQDRRGAAPRPDLLRQEDPPIPERIGPCRFGRLGSWITVQCPDEFDALLMEAGAVWVNGAG